MDRFLSNQAILIYESLSALIMLVMTMWLGRKNKNMKKELEELQEKSKMKQLKSRLSNSLR